MNGAARIRLACTLAARAAAIACVVMAVISGHLDGGWRAAADGPQGALRLRPTAVDAATDPFTLELPPGARCEEDGTGSGQDTDPGPRTGADNWRWHGFIVESGRDLSTLRFGPYGPGQDFDATDGELTAPLYLAGQEGLWSQLPALKPEGQINPDTLSGVQLYPHIYTLVDGDYELGVACIDGAMDTRQWWSVTATVRGAGPPFLTEAVADDAPAPSGAVPVDTAAGEGSGTSTPVDDAGAPPAAAGAVEAAPSASLPPTAPSGVSWAPLRGPARVSSALPGVGWALLAAVLLRISYLLAVPTRARSPFQAAIVRPVPKGSAS